MTRPQKVLGFLDVAGHWDPSLILVLGGAVAIATVTFHFILRCRSPLLAPSFDLPTSKTIDSKLVIGALIFGAGWGLSGYCPGPAIAQLAVPDAETLYFLPALLAGWWLYGFAARRNEGTRPR